MTLYSRLCKNKTLCESSVVKVSEKETLRTLYDEHDIGAPSRGVPISCVLLKSLSDVLAHVGYDFCDFYGGQYEGMAGQAPPSSGRASTFLQLFGNLIMAMHILYIFGFYQH